MNSSTAASPTVACHWIYPLQQLNMFGLTPQISDKSLYLLHDMVEGMLQNSEHSLKDTPKEKTKDMAQLILTIAYYKQELDLFEIDITKQLKESFQFAVEELYYMYGQYDKFVGIEFHKFSDTAKKYGRHIGGIFIYGKNERKDLESKINSENIHRTNGLVKIDVSSNYNLTEHQIKDLIEVGFKSGDIHEILNSNTTLANAFTQQGKKEIPNTINVNADFTKTDPFKLTLYNLNMRLKDGRILIKSEWDEYYGYNLYYSPEIKKDTNLKEKIYNKDGTKKKEIRFYELIAKHRNSDLIGKERNEFSDLLKKRRIERFEILKMELNKTGITSVEQFKIYHPEIYMEVYMAALTFDDEVLTYTKSPIPVYWDFKSYLHIYLRHCDELQPAGHFNTKTPFAYSRKDIKRILTIAVEQQEDKIQARLSQALDFRTYGEKALYFNGNYYSMRIESSGRVDSFHPND